jgi:hypothetical protein
MSLKIAKGKSESVNRRRTDNTMAKRRKTDNTMAKRRKTENTMAKRRRTDNTMAKTYLHWTILFNLNRS